MLGARCEDRLKQIAGAIKSDGGQAVHRPLDVTQPADNDAIVKLAKEAFGRVDVMFLNAGFMPNSPLSALKTGEWHSLADVNIKGVLNGVAAVLPAFIEQNPGTSLPPLPWRGSRLIRAAPFMAERNGGADAEHL